MSAMYASARQAFIASLLSDTIKAALIDTGTYTYSGAHQNYSDLSGVIGTPVTLTGKTVTSGIFDADDPLFAAVTGPTIEAVVLYKDTGNPATSSLIAFIDGITVLPTGGDIIIRWDNGASRIFAL